MSEATRDLEAIRVIDREVWKDGPPHELFARMREQCPVHWSDDIEEFPEEPGYWWVTRWEDIHAVSRDWKTDSSELGRVAAVTEAFPIGERPAVCRGMEQPQHGSLKMPLHAGFTRKRIAGPEPRVTAIVK